MTFLTKSEYTTVQPTVVLGASLLYSGWRSAECIPVGICGSGTVITVRTRIESSRIDAQFLAVFKVGTDGTTCSVRVGSARARRNDYELNVGHNLSRRGCASEPDIRHHYVCLTTSTGYYCYCYCYCCYCYARNVTSQRLVASSISLVLVPCRG